MGEKDAEVIRRCGVAGERRGLAGVDRLVAEQARPIQASEAEPCREHEDRDEGKCLEQERSARGEHGTRVPARH